MSLIKCSECGKEVSDQAASCPNCGNPIQGHSIQNISLTKKEWKIYKVVALIIVLVSLLSFYERMNGLGFFLLALGILIGAYAGIGAWWTNG